MTYDGNKVISWAECLWRPDGAHLATAGDWYVRNPDGTDQIDGAAYLMGHVDSLSSRLSVSMDGRRVTDPGALQRLFGPYNYNPQYQIYRFGIDKPKDGK